MEQLISRLISMGLFRYLGIGAIGVFIWYIGPYIGFLRPVTNRIIAIVAVLLLYGLYLLVTSLLSKKKEDRLSNELAADAEKGADPSVERSREELATLKAKFDEALQILRKSRKSKYRTGSLYALPWYMIIGPPGSGKTTLLVNSGLQFPLAEKMGLSKLQGIGGTRFCDWWFTDEAVIIDTAGRYTTQDSDEQVDNTAWMGFLKMLRKNRKRRPINGIIVAVSIDELARQSEVDRERTASAVTQRIQELYEQLGVRFPVYVMFTKCDLMSGFMEFFGDLDRHQREQVWGTTFPVVSNSLEIIDGELDLLQDRIQSRLVQRLQQERDPARRNLIYNFVGLFSSARPLVMDFISRVFKPSRFTETPLLRGVYFTSGTQEGTPFNRLINQLAKNFNLSGASALGRPVQGKSFFIRDLLSNVIFGESGLAGVNLKAERLYGLIRTGTMTALVALPIIMIGLWWWSAHNNRALIDVLATEVGHLEGLIEDANPRQHDLMEVLPILNQARDLTAGYATRSASVPTRLEMGLYQGDRLGRKGTIPAYRNVLENAFLSRILLRLEERLRASLENPMAAHRLLKTYLMLGNDERLEDDYVRQSIRQDWKEMYRRNISRDEMIQLEQHLDALLDLRPFNLPFVLDANLIEHARIALSRMSHAERIYGIVKDEMGTMEPEFSVVSSAGPNAVDALQRVSREPLNRGVPAMFSPVGYDAFIGTLERAVDQDQEDYWVYRTNASGPELNRDDLIDQATRLYFEDYIETWWAFLNDVRIKEFNSFREAAELLDIISDSKNSPLLLFLKGAAKETRLAETGSEESETDDEESFLDSMGDAVGDIFDQEGDAIVTAADPSVVDRAFAPLNDLFSPGEDGRSPISGIIKDLENLYIYLDRIAERGMGAASAADRQDLSRAVDTLKRRARRAEPPLGDWIEDIAGRSDGLVANRARQNLDALWQTEVASFCRQAIGNRYPFSAETVEEVRLQDFGKFFSPGGRLDNFFNTHLKSSVNMNTDPWRLKSESGISVSSRSLRQIQIAQQIKEAFFADGGSQPQVTFTMTPYGLDANTLQFMLKVDGQLINYDHGPRIPQRMKWPGSDVTGQVQIQFSPETELGGTRIKTGDWAWFRILDESEVSDGAGSADLRITFRLADRWATYDLSSSSATNPFNLRRLRAFRCEPNL